MEHEVVSPLPKLPATQQDGVEFLNGDVWWSLDGVQAPSLNVGVYICALIAAQNCCAKGHWKILWDVVSAANPHMSQQSSSNIFLLFRFYLHIGYVLAAVL